MDNVVTAFKVAAADTEYSIDASTYTILMTTTQTTVTQDGTAVATAKTWKDALKEYTRIYNWNR